MVRFWQEYISRCRHGKVNFEFLNLNSGHVPFKTLSKDPGPEGPALVCPGGVCFNPNGLVESWNDGMMEFWESKADDGLILSFDPCHP